MAKLQPQEGTGAWRPAGPGDLQELAGRITALLDAFGRCGADPDGGYTRYLYSGAWQEAQCAVSREMKAAGLSVYYDEAGNLFGRLEGSSAEEGAVLTGSHIDTVRCGGLYDGAAGIAAAVAAIELLHRRCGQPRRTLEAVSLCEEEGSRFPLTFWGSGSIAGRYAPDAPPEAADRSGITLAEAMKAAGFGPGTHRSARRTDIGAFVELHIEQGAVLEQERLDLGVVLGIVGQRRWTFTLRGEANHAGTTPMRLRRDALAGACEMILEAERQACAYGEAMVATAGSVSAAPGLSNVIAGQAVFTLDVRHPDAETLQSFCDELYGIFEGIAASRELEFAGEQWMNVLPAPMDARLCEAVEAAAKGLGLRSRRMYSGAGHDAQVFSGSFPAAMLFVPSSKGLSHSPEEYTSPEQLARGAAALCNVLYTLAYEEEEKEKGDSQHENVR
ncbi:hydantoinase/carbamoylase family amidase [Paenibacillus caseinilyticus]|uniref:Allantoate amidohydrolase n=1 Tax=Paenibacillus mucilaginosus K02 TaxID=997761 RepID=I0BJM4_9BACL|nr:Zn-dependent hydrolase [Paenibacillus mucilaginosus]AFH62571.1 allantoate amidohydrolase [Paenibacillus mucilaginosus K02]